MVGLQSIISYPTNLSVTDVIQGARKEGGSRWIYIDPHMNLLKYPFQLKLLQPRFKLLVIQRLIPQYSKTAYAATWH
jgi:hypothetical protein